MARVATVVMLGVVDGAVVMAVVPAMAAMVTVAVWPRTKWSCSEWTCPWYRSEHVAVVAVAWP